MINTIILNDNNIDEYFLFTDDSTLIKYNKKENKYDELIKLENINSKKEMIVLKLMHPYICITEEKGLNSSVVNIETLETINLKREDYHSDVSSYSNEFCIINNEIHLITQTKWNTLDIMNLKTKKMITDTNRDEEKFSIDYFHSNLLVSKDYKHFLSNGWIWNPVDCISYFNIDEFLKEYEKCQVDVVNEYISGYNWDRPVAFIDDKKIVLACDNTNFNDEDFIYNQLMFYNIDDIKIDDSNNNEYKYLESYKSINTNLFSLDEYNEVHGKLYYYKDNLIALDSKNNNINIYNLNNNTLKNICTMPSNKTYFSDKFGIIYYIDNDIIKEINIECYL
ncbi:hypothetical protein [uncultured Brachyspira sp.]|uniref:hypothetical protein n=1 Tax=uncultured Brachyspira sp. TaxID=221953 RepID=UPI0026174105|nr:hypothetical protein [uncultured Brachyspira sp.]